MMKAEVAAAKTGRAKAEVMSKAVGSNQNGKLSPLEMCILFKQYGLPDSEVGSIMKGRSGEDDRIDIDEFEKHFKPLWRFIFNTMSLQVRNKLRG